MLQFLCYESQLQSFPICLLQTIHDFTSFSHIPLSLPFSRQILSTYLEIWIQKLFHSLDLSLVPTYHVRASRLERHSIQDASISETFIPMHGSGFGFAPSVIIAKIWFAFLSTKDGSDIFLNISRFHRLPGYLLRVVTASLAPSVFCFCCWHYNTQIYPAFSPSFYHPITQYHETLFLSCVMLLLP